MGENTPANESFYVLLLLNMKYLFPIVAIALITIASCKKEEEDRFSYKWLKQKESGTLTAKINGQPWYNNLVLTRVNSNSKQGKYAIEASYYIGDVLKQDLTLNFIDPKRSIQKIYASSIYDPNLPYTIQRPLDTLVGSFGLQDQDVIENIYEVNDSADNNYLYIDHYDPEKQAIKGRFSMTLYRRYQHANQTQGFPDTLKITDGTFDVKVVDF